MCSIHITTFKEANMTQLHYVYGLGFVMEYYDGSLFVAVLVVAP